MNIIYRWRECSGKARYMGRCWWKDHVVPRDHLKLWATFTMVIMFTMLTKIMQNVMRIIVFHLVFLVFTTLSLLFCTGLFDTECIFVFLFVISTRLALYRFVLQIPMSDEWISAQMAFPCLLHWAERDQPCKVKYRCKQSNIWW